jgi:D-3-phosphoglycerate dehydrogenase
MKIVINYQEYADVEAEKKVLKGLGEVEVIESRTRDPGEFMAEAAGADGALVQYVPVNEKVIKAMKGCKVIVRYGIAYDNIDVVAARAAGITVCHVPSYCISEVSNHALALILALHRKLFTADRAMRDGSYSLETIRPILRFGKCRAGLVGLGRIAQELALKLRPLVREVWAYDPFVDKSVFGQAGAREKKLDQIFAECDIISVHVPVNKKTRHLVSKEMIGKMKPTACLVNTSRGAVVDEAALAEALRHGKIAGAGLDVFETEPLAADSPLKKLDNVILTGHYAWYSEGAIKELKETAAMEAVRVLKGEAPHHPVPEL